MEEKFRPFFFFLVRKEVEGFSLLSRCVGLNRGNELEHRGFSDAKLAASPSPAPSLSLTSDLCLQAKMQGLDNSASNVNLKQCICNQHLCS